MPYADGMVSRGSRGRPLNAPAAFIHPNLTVLRPCHCPPHSHSSQAGLACSASQAGAGSGKLSRRHDL